MPSSPVELRTRRVLLRQWRDADREPFAALNADRQVMQHFPNALSRAESDALVDRIMADMAERGWGLWVVEITETSAFAGFVGLSLATFEAPFTPAVEIGWRLARAQWGKGLATEAGRAVLDYGFGHAGLEEIVSFTSSANLRSPTALWSGWAWCVTRLTISSTRGCHKVTTCARTSSIGLRVLSRLRRFHVASSLVGEPPRQMNCRIPGDPAKNAAHLREVLVVGRQVGKPMTVPSGRQRALSEVCQQSDAQSESSP